jgi:hypothetical protein
MSDDAIPAPEPDPGPDPVRLSEDIAALTELTAGGIEVDGETQLAESIWVVYGHTSYDGEIVVGEYQDAVEATEVLRAASRPHPDPDEPVP